MYQDEKGFTMLELLLSLLIMSIIIGSVLPSINLIDRQKIKTNLQRISWEIKQTQNESKKNNNETAYLLEAEKIWSPIEIIRIEIAYYGKKENTELYLRNKESMNVEKSFKLLLDSRGRFYTINDMGDKMYIKNIQIDFNKEKINESIIINGVTGNLMKR